MTSDLTCAKCTTFHTVMADSSFSHVAYIRVTTCLENLEMSGNLKHVREMSGILLTVRELSGECQGKNFVRENCPKSVHY